MLRCLAAVYIFIVLYIVGFDWFCIALIASFVRKMHFYFVLFLHYRCLLLHFILCVVSFIIQSHSHQCFCCSFWCLLKLYVMRNQMVRVCASCTCASTSKEGKKKKSLLVLLVCWCFDKKNKIATTWNNSNKEYIEDQQVFVMYYRRSSMWKE